MDVVGEALSISRAQMFRLAEEAEVPPDVAGRMIDGICDVASRLQASPRTYTHRLLLETPCARSKAASIRT
ncbi:serine kinase HipA [Pseudomonas sp. Ag1]|jgi:hypothetical protein|nr:serine kinase HipA [Pseudomonas sp. Ag1]